MSARFGRNQKRKLLAEIAERDRVIVNQSLNLDKTHRWRAQESLRADQLKVMVDKLMQYKMDALKIVEDGSIQFRVQLENAMQNASPINNQVTFDYARLRKLADMAEAERRSYVDYIARRIADDMMRYLGIHWSLRR